MPMIHAFVAIGQTEHHGMCLTHFSRIIDVHVVTKKDKP